MKAAAAQGMQRMDKRGMIYLLKQKRMGSKTRIHAHVCVCISIYLCKHRY